jgi:hypothetical protein
MEMPGVAIAILLKCSVYKQNVTFGYEGNTRYAPPCHCIPTLRCPRGGGKSVFEIPIRFCRVRDQRVASWLATYRGMCVVPEGAAPE